MKSFIMIVPQTSSLTEQLTVKLVSEFPVLLVYIFSARWALLQLKDFWKLYVGQVANREQSIIEAEKLLTIRLAVLENNLVTMDKELKEIENDTKHIKTKLSDVQNYLNIRGRQNDKSTQ